MTSESGIVAHCQSHACTIGVPHNTMRRKHRRCATYTKGSGDPCTRSQPPRGTPNPLMVLRSSRYTTASIGLSREVLCAVTPVLRKQSFSTVCASVMRASGRCVALCILAISSSSRTPSSILAKVTARVVGSPQRCSMNATGKATAISQSRSRKTGWSWRVAMELIARFLQWIIIHPQSCVYVYM